MQSMVSIRQRLLRIYLEEPSDDKNRFYTHIKKHSLLESLLQEASNVAFQDVSEQGS
jgi:hypothetical protein